MKTITSAEILCVGTELLLGDIINTNASFMSQRLAALGIPVYRQAVVGDNPDRLKSALAEAFARTDTVFLSGGLGPTGDDLTKETVAEFFGLAMYSDERSLARIRGYFADIGRPMPESNAKQALIPQGAVIFDNDWGTAPAMAVECGDKTAVLLPGPPVELVPLWNTRVEPYLQSRSGSVILSRNLFIMNMGESAVEEKLKEMTFSANPTVATYAKDGEVRVRVSARAADEATAGALCDAMIDTILATEVGPFVYGIDVDSAENALVCRLRAAGKTLAVAESCTGGLLAKRVTDLAGCSDVFLGGCVTYANEAKIKLLGVNPETLAAHGAVSEQTAREMARGVRIALGASMGLATTGIAGPGGGTPEKPVGTVYVAVSTEAGETVKRLSMSPLRSRGYIRFSASTQAFGLGLDALARENGKI